MAATATAASKALPPERSTSRPAWVASGWALLTIPRVPTAGPGCGAGVEKALSGGGVERRVIAAGGSLDWQAARERRNSEPRSAGGRVDKEVLPKETETLAQGFHSTRQRSPTARMGTR